MMKQMPNCALCGIQLVRTLIEIDDDGEDLCIECCARELARLRRMCAEDAVLREALLFAKEVIDDQIRRFHKDCRCQLCESLPMMINAALDGAAHEAVLDSSHNQS
jgi:hypothetical protein